jgi:RNA-directed DNA polymerase
VLSKQYALAASPLYRISSIHKLAQVLLLEKKSLLALENSIKTNPDKHYRIFKQGVKKREIQHPFEKNISNVQKRLKVLFSRIKPPDYVKSGRKGVSYVDNAAAHIPYSYCIPMDIRKFYESTKGEVVFQFFLHKLEIVSDLARLLTNLTTYQEISGRQKIPTGSSFSQLLAYWAYSDMFDRINSLALSVNANFTLYVDDMTFSSNNPFPEDFHKLVQEILATRGLRFKASKLHRLYPNQPKDITGCTITPQKTLVAPKALKKKAVHAIKKALHTEAATLADIQRARGLVQSVRQIEPDIFEVSSNQLNTKQKSYS